ncbi:uncharacterized protein PHALS_06836 [Plasmopara halstedii]|uniref:Uncharacterized protein n=1 Tax=Plasmopara halstedii TaxID=4781 RepID=A0A0P1B5T2_PLAHL|nr:uncharacterized protein PHALS_06836 [Plasmopara halstedii]CEG49046.1 hypothetical protein PHALS_06836 [Plasmopara halstedii]|eukprot:XP_024585415.1 hypothetical protein PHALS_06836 [Plasmopara halstedii]
MEDLETSAILDFHGIPDVVTVQVQQQYLHMKTGNSKRFPVFIHMLLTVFVNLLTTTDLDLYRQRKVRPKAALERNDDHIT